MIRAFIRSNVSWLLRYFEQCKGLIEMFTFFIAAQAFLYSNDLQALNHDSLVAIRTVFWIFIFLILALLLIRTSFDFARDDDNLTTSIFDGARFAKAVMRLLALTLFLASLQIVLGELGESLHNKFFAIFWIALGLTALSEIIIGVIAALPKPRRR